MVIDLKLLGSFLVACACVALLVIGVSNNSKGGSKSSKSTSSKSTSSKTTTSTSTTTDTTSQG